MRLNLLGRKLEGNTNPRTSIAGIEVSGPAKGEVGTLTVMVMESESPTAQTAPSESG